MRFEKILFITVFVGLGAALLDIITKLAAIALVPGMVIFNHLEGGNHVLPLDWSFAVSTGSLVLGLFSLMVAKDRISPGAVKSFAIGLGFILGALAQLYETLAFPVIDFIPVHTYLLMDFLHESGWAVANLADLYKPVGILFMCYGTARFIRESAGESVLARSLCAAAGWQKSRLARLVWERFVRTLPCP